MSALALPRHSTLYVQCKALVQAADCILVVGLPGVGKSLLLQQLSILAAEQRRPLQLLQWDIARQPFESPHYPLVDGATDPRLIQAVGTWARGAIAGWRAAAPRAQLLLVEAPLIGGRFIELARPAADRAEAFLRGQSCHFLLPLPSVELRAHILAQRAASIAAPRHPNEAHDAPPELLHALWQELYTAARQLGMQPPALSATRYDPAIYDAVYSHVLRQRQLLRLPLDEALPRPLSVYAGLEALPQLQASRTEAAAMLEQLAQQPAPAARQWFEP